MANNCDELYCDWKIEDGALVWAPCGTFEYNEDGSLIKPDKADIGEIDEVDELGNPVTYPWYFEDASSVTMNTPRTNNSKKTLRCRENCSSSIDTNSIDIEHCWCWKNPLHVALSDPEESCTIDVMYFPEPANCDMPDPATDLFYYITVKGGTDSIGGAASNTEGETVSTSLTACGRGFRRCNTGMDEEVVLEGQKAETKTKLTLEKAA